MKDITFVLLINCGQRYLYMSNVRKTYIHIMYITAIIFVLCAGSPTLTSIPDQIVRVNLSEEVVLNCSVSSSPDPMYSWFIPNNCLFCPHSYNYSVLTFTANTSNSGEYICTADNKHGNISVVFNVFVIGM